MVRQATEEEGNKVTHHMIARYQTANKKSTQVWNFFSCLVNFRIHNSIVIETNGLNSKIIVHT